MYILIIIWLSFLLKVILQPQVSWLAYHLMYTQDTALMMQ